MTPNFLAVLRALNNGCQVNLDGLIYSLCEKKDGGLAISFLAHDEYGNEVWMEDQSWTLNGFISTCDKLSQTDMVGIVGGSVLRSLSKS